MPDVSPVRSRVFPAGTAMPSRMISVQLVLDAVTSARVVKVQLVRLAGAAATKDAEPAMRAIAAWVKL